MFFITGSSGIGKTTILPLLKEKLPLDFDVHDFDEKLTEEVGMNPSLLDSWRKKTTRYWIKYANKNLKKGKHTVIIGLIYPKEARQLSNTPYSLCLLDSSEYKIKERLMGKRFSNVEKIEKLKQATGKTPEEFIRENRVFMEQLRNDVKEEGWEIIDTSLDTPEKTANKLNNWIIEKLE